RRVARLPGAAPRHCGAPRASACTASDTPQAAAQAVAAAACWGTGGTCTAYAYEHFCIKHACCQMEEGHASPGYIRCAFWTLHVSSSGAAMTRSGTGTPCQAKKPQPSGYS